MDFYSINWLLPKDLFKSLTFKTATLLINIQAIRLKMYKNILFSNDVFTRSVCFVHPEKLENLSCTRRLR